MALEIGIKAPNFTLPSTIGKDFTLDITKFGKPLILYFYPADFTLGCTNEACGYRDTFELFQSFDIDIVGISKDSLESHYKFKTQYNLPYELLTDANMEIANLYQVTIPIINFTKRTTYLLDRYHKISSVYENIFVAKMHIQEMIKKAKGMNQMAKVI